MADNKKWFKVWVAILTDPDSAMGLWRRGLWVTLGLLIAQSGTGGSIEFEDEEALCDFVKYQDKRNTTLTNAAILGHIKSLPNVDIGQSDGKITVTFLNWRLYQADTTGASRQQRYRDRQKRNKSVTGGVTKWPKRRYKSRHGETTVTGPMFNNEDELSREGVTPNRDGVRREQEENKKRTTTEGVVVGEKGGKEKLRDQLITKGVSPGKAEELVNGFMPERITAVLRACTEQEPNKPGGWCVTALEESWNVEQKYAKGEKGVYGQPSAEESKERRQKEKTMREVMAEEQAAKAAIIGSMSADQWERLKIAAREALNKELPNLSKFSTSMIEHKALRLYEEMDRAKIAS